MKNIIIILMACTLSIGCSKETKEVIEDSLIGKWQLIETCEGGTPSGWACNPVEDGLILNFKSNNSFTKEGGLLGNCNLGTYTYNNTTIILIYTNSECGNVNEPIERIFTFENKNLVLSPLTGLCPEGCTSRYKKIQ